MVYEKIDLYKYFNLKRGEGISGYLQTYVPHSTPELKKKVRPAMLVIPGGGYVWVSDREAEPVALKFMINGYCSFVLNYSVNTAYPVPLLEACMAMVYLRENAEKYCIERKHIGAIGFSAGGHLAGMLSNIYNENEITDILGEKAHLARPDAVVLSYPVITMGDKTHQTTCETITGLNPKLIDKLSIEKRVTKNSAPAFIWHTVEDPCVPVENSMLLASAYKNASVPFALHLFEKGGHGLSLCTAETHNLTRQDKLLEYIGKWFELAMDWLASCGFCVEVEE